MDNKALWLACLHEALLHVQDNVVSTEELITIVNRLYLACLEATTH